MIIPSNAIVIAARVDRMNMDSLYTQESHLKLKDALGMYACGIGLGLFSNLSYRAGDKVGKLPCGKLNLSVLSYQQRRASVERG
jgi:hypothetical protein